MADPFFGSIAIGGRFDHPPGHRAAVDPAVRCRGAGRRPTSAAGRAGTAGHRDRPGGRGGGGGDRRPARRRQRRAVPVLGDPSARAAFTAGRHGGPAAVDAAPHRPPGTRPGRLSGRCRRHHPIDDPADGPAPGRDDPGHPDGGRGDRPVRAWSSSWSRWPTPGSTWSRSVARSPSAAAFSTCSRRPPITRCGSSSSATRSPTSGRSVSSTSDRCRRSSSVTAPPCREILLTADVRARAAALSAQQHRRPDAGPDARQPGQRDQRRGHGIADPGAGRRRPRTAARTWSGRGPTCCSPTRSGSGPGPPTWSAPATSSWPHPGWPRRPAGGRRSTSARRRTGAWRTRWTWSGTPSCRSGGSRRSTPANRPETPTAAAAGRRRRAAGGRRPRLPRRAGRRDRRRPQAAGGRRLDRAGGRRRRHRGQGGRAACRGRHRAWSSPATACRRRRAPTWSPWPAGGWRTASCCGIPGWRS